MHLDRFLFRPTLNAPSSTLAWSGTHIYPMVQKCEVNIQMGIFFDGTNNNLEQDEENLSHSNVARLFQAYPEKEENDLYRLYLSGVGTSFKDIGEDTPRILGGMLGDGGEERILYALLQVINVIYKRRKQVDYYSEKDIKRLLNTWRGSTAKDGISPRGYCAVNKEATSIPFCKKPIGDLSNRTYDKIRESYFKNTSEMMAKLLENTRPRVMEMHLDVFGFSRGAAQARVFCHWLHRAMSGGKFCGVNVRIRFLGIFDTVASVGASLGHANWAKTEYLRIPEMVENCVHMVAMHEQRSSFPLDSIRTSASMDNPHWIEVAYPGSHSDVGGGYAPGEMGVAMPAAHEKAQDLDKAMQKYDANKLSQIPLQHMYQCAKKVCVPLDAENVNGKKTGYNPFTTSRETIDDYAAFIHEKGITGMELHEWAQPYLNWHYQVMDSFETLRQYKVASKEHQRFLAEANNSLRKYIRPTAEQEKLSANIRLFSNGKTPRHTKGNTQLGANRYASSAICKEAVRSTPVSRKSAQFFDRYVHDSYAGFAFNVDFLFVDTVVREPLPYMRSRKIFAGGDQAINR